MRTSSRQCRDAGPLYKMYFQSFGEQRPHRSFLVQMFPLGLCERLKLRSILKGTEVLTVKTFSPKLLHTYPSAHVHTCIYIYAPCMQGLEKWIGWSSEGTGQRRKKVGIGHNMKREASFNFPSELPYL